MELATLGNKMGSLIIIALCAMVGILAYILFRKYRELQMKTNEQMTLIDNLYTAIDLHKEVNLELKQENLKITEQADKMLVFMQTDCPVDETKLDTETLETSVRDLETVVDEMSLETYDKTLESIQECSEEEEEDCDEVTELIADFKYLEEETIDIMELVAEYQDLEELDEVKECDIEIVIDDGEEFTEEKIENIFNCIDEKIYDDYEQEKQEILEELRVAEEEKNKLKTKSQKKSKKKSKGKKKKNDD